MRRPILSVVLIAALLCSAPGLQAAESPASDHIEMAALARSTGLPLPAPGEMEGPEVTYQGDAPQPFWQLWWTGRGERAGLETVSVTLDDASYHVLSFWRMKRLQCLECQPAVQLVTLTRSEAQTNAEKWVSALAPDLQGALQPLNPPLRGGQPPGLMENRYYFAWRVTRHGYPVTGREVTAVIDAATGELQGFSRPYDLTAETVPPDVPPDPEPALRTYREGLAMELQYRLYPQGGTLGWRLVYRPTAPTLPRVDLEGQLVDQPPPASARELVAAPDSPWERPAQPLTQDQALAVAIAATGLTEAPAAQYSEWVGGAGGYWSFTWPTGMATVDAQTGLLVSISLAPHGDDSSPLTQDEAKALALEFIRRHRPDLAGSLLLVPGSSASYDFAFVPTRDGVVLANRTVRVTVHPRQRRVTNFHVQPFEPVEERFPFSPADGAISREAALDKFVQANPLELVWAVSYPDGSPVAQLLRAPRWPDADAVDALTGALLDGGGDELRPGPFLPADLEGRHEARAVEILAAMGVIRLLPGPFEPDKPAALSDLTDWLTRAFGKGVFTLPDQPPDSPVAREVLALWAVRAMGYGALAEMKNRIELPFMDRDEIDPRYANAIAILNGLGLAPGGGETSFEPKRAVTRGEAAEMLLGAVQGRR